MKAVIASYRRNRHTVRPTHMIIEVEGVDNREKAEKLVGKTVAYDTGKKKISGKIASAHGKKGAVRAIFEIGMPGQALGQVVVIA